MEARSGRVVDLTHVLCAHAVAVHDELGERRGDLLHIVGGGGKNTLLSQMTADAIGRPVVVGPYEATAMGNVLVQAMATSEVRDVNHLRRIVADSFELMTYQPASGGDWDEAASRREAFCA